MERVLEIFPKTIQDELIRIDKKQIDTIEEIRIRVNRPIEITGSRMTRYLSYIVREEDAEHLLNKISNHSLYVLDEELKRGYITIQGGHRIGLAGKVILENGHVKAIRSISSFNIRIAREKIGIAEKWLPYLFKSGWKNLLIIGPPQSGKTTLLRDIARIISTGYSDLGIQPQKVGIVDERSEIAGSVNGVPQLTFGIRVDVMDACPKAEGMMMMIRSMSPDVLVCDEIGRKEDTEAVLEAVHAGIKLIMTTHGDSFQDIINRPTLKPIIDQKIFERYIELSPGGGPGFVASIKNEEGKEILQRVGQ